MVYFTKVSDLKTEKWVAESNSSLVDIAKFPDLYEYRYEEHLSKFDPFKKRVLEGLTNGMSMANVSYSTSLRDSMHGQKQQDIGFNDAQYPFSPDVIVGYKGHKVLMNVIPSSQTMTDI